MRKKQLSLAATPIGQDAVIVYLPKPVQDNYPSILHNLAEHIKPLGIIDCVIAYHSLLVIFDRQKQRAEKITRHLQNALPEAVAKASQPEAQSIIRIPVCYDDTFAPDLAEVAERAHLSKTALITHHSQKNYTVCCLGFTPGFAFLGYVDDKIATPRRANSRANVPAGSVGIAGQQTGVYPSHSPGGWNIIGRTPMALYAPERGLYSRFTIGDTVQFYAISRDDFNAWNDTDV